MVYILRWDDADTTTTFRTVLRIWGWDGEFGAFIHVFVVHEKNDILQNKNIS